MERLRGRVHSLSSELTNIERQVETTGRIVSELDLQINALGSQIERITADLIVAEDALAEKRAILDHRLAEIAKRGPLFAAQVLLAAESFGDLLSRYKYLYLVSRQDRQLVRDVDGAARPRRGAAQRPPQRADRPRPAARRAVGGERALPAAGAAAGAQPARVAARAAADGSSGSSSWRATRPA